MANEIKKAEKAKKAIAGIKEDKEMIFEYEGATYRQTENNYFYRETADKKCRISREAFEEAKKLAEKKEEEVVITDEVTLVSDCGMGPKVVLAKVNGKYMVKREGDESSEFEAVAVVMSVNPDKGNRQCAGFNYHGYHYWVVSGKVENKGGKKARKARKPKDIAYEKGDLRLTSKQVDFIKHIPDTSFYEDGLDSVLWCDCLCDEIGGQFKGNPFLCGAMISTLREKGLVTVTRDTSREGKPKAMAFTEIGKKVAKELGL